MGAGSAYTMLGRPQDLKKFVGPGPSSSARACRGVQGGLDSGVVVCRMFVRRYCRTTTREPFTLEPAPSLAVGTLLHNVCILHMQKKWVPILGRQGCQGMPLKTKPREASALIFD